MLGVEAATISYGRTVAVRGIDLTVADGQVVALLGPSGCGKSTLLRAISGLEPLTAGRIRWDGVDLASVPVHRRGFGLMFQDGVLFGHRSVAGNVAYGLRRAGLDRTAIAGRVAALLALVGLAGYGDRAVGTLSGGEQQRVALARALAPEPRLLLLDEPLAALDRALRDRLLADLAQVLRTTRTTAVFVTHDQGEAFAVADRVAVMRAGEIRQTGAPEEVWRRPVDEWVARFIGYTSVLPGRQVGAFVETAVGTIAGHGVRVALRPTALRVDEHGALPGTCVSVVAGPDGDRLTVDLAGAGTVQAVAEPGRGPAAGTAVRLRFDPSSAALLDH